MAASHPEPVSRRNGDVHRTSRRKGWTYPGTVPDRTSPPLVQGTCWNVIEVTGNWRALDAYASAFTGSTAAECDKRRQGNVSGVVGSHYQNGTERYRQDSRYRYRVILECIDLANCA